MYLHYGSCTSIKPKVLIHHKQGSGHRYFSVETSQEWFRYIPPIRHIPPSGSDPHLVVRKEEFWLRVRTCGSPFSILHDKKSTLKSSGAYKVLVVRGRIQVLNAPFNMGDCYNVLSSFRLLSYILFLISDRKLKGTLEPILTTNSRQSSHREETYNSTTIIGGLYKSFP